MDGEDHVGRYRLVHEHKFIVTIITIINIINPQRMQLYSRSLCVCVSIITPAATYLVYTMRTRCHYRLFTAFLKYECVNFIENISFKSSGDITATDHHGLLCFLMSC